MSLIQEIALELSIKTGQVYTCPKDDFIQGPDHAYWVRIQSWTKRLAADFTGPNNKSPYKTNTITLDPNRPAEALARDILRRLPPNQAAEYYTKAAEYLAKKAEEERVYKETEALFRKLGFRPYWHDRGTEKFYKDGFHAEFYQSSASDVKLTIEKLTPAQAVHIIEFTEMITNKKGK